MTMTSLDYQCSQVMIPYTAVLFYVLPITTMTSPDDITAPIENPPAVLIGIPVHPLAQQDQFQLVVQVP